MSTCLSDKMPKFGSVPNLYDHGLHFLDKLKFFRLHFERKNFPSGFRICTLCFPILRENIISNNFLPYTLLVPHRNWYCTAFIQYLYFYINVHSFLSLQRSSVTFHSIVLELGCFSRHLAGWLGTEGADPGWEWDAGPHAPQANNITLSSVFTIIYFLSGGD